LEAPPTAPYERTVVLGAGGALEVDSGVSGGGAAFVEYEALPEVIELELGGQIVSGAGGKEVSGDLLFKWPHRLTQQLEIMVGVGPTLTSRSNAPTARGIAGAADLMWWPRHHAGLWVEPSWEVRFRGGALGPVTLTAGPIVGW
jgi:hypothetical protein